MLKPLVVCNNVQISINSKVIVKELSISFKRGNVLFITGRNGSGKTTLLRYLSGGYWHPQIQILGKPSKLLNIQGGLDKFLTAKENIIKLSIQLNLKFNNYKNLVDSILEISDLDFTILNERLSRLSHGTVMRLAFALTYINALEKDYLVMDEWLSVGDIEFKKKSNALLKKLIFNSNIGVIIATNSPIIHLHEHQSVLNLDNV